MPPCHGGDRRFESGRARHIKSLRSKSEAFYIGKTYRIRTGVPGALPAPCPRKTFGRGCTVLLDEDSTSLREFLSCRISYPVYSMTVVGLRYGISPYDRGVSYENIEGRRKVAAAEFVMSVSQAIRNLEVAAKFGAR